LPFSPSTQIELFVQYSASQVCPKTCGGCPGEYGVINGAAKVGSSSAITTLRLARRRYVSCIGFTAVL